MKHEWQRDLSMADKHDHGFHPLDTVRRCLNCHAYQKREQLYEERTRPEFMPQRFLSGDAAHSAQWIDMHDKPFVTMREAIRHIDQVRDNNSQGIISRARVVEVVGEWVFD